MTHKFKPTITDKLTKMNKDMIRERERKREELEDKYIPKSVKDKLTPDEVKRSSKIGIGFGLVGILIVIVLFMWYLWTVLY